MNSTYSCSRVRISASMRWRRPWVRCVSQAVAIVADPPTAEPRIAESAVRTAGSKILSFVRRPGVEPRPGWPKVARPDTVQRLPGVARGRVREQHRLATQPTLGCRLLEVELAALMRSRSPGGAARSSRTRRLPARFER